jgi:hypothetical protein
MAKQADLKALQNLVEQALTMVSHDPMFPGSRQACVEVLEAALAISKIVARQPLRPFGDG